MASKKKIVEMLGSIKTIYSYYAKDANVEVLVNTWGALLKAYTDEQVETAFFAALQSCKVPPTPADIIERIGAAQAGETDEELWGVLVTALRDTAKFVYRLQYPRCGEDPRAEIENIWLGLPDKLRQYVGSKGELMRMSGDATEDGLKYEKPRFFKSMAALKGKESLIPALAEGTPLKAIGHKPSYDMATIEQRFELGRVRA